MQIFEELEPLLVVLLFTCSSATHSSSLFSKSVLDTAQFLCEKRDCFAITSRTYLLRHATRVSFEVTIFPAACSVHAIPLSQWDQRVATGNNLTKTTLGTERTGLHAAQAKKMRRVSVILSTNSCFSITCL